MRALGQPSGWPRLSHVGCLNVVRFAAFTLALLSSSCSSPRAGFSAQPDASATTDATTGSDATPRCEPFACDAGAPVHHVVCPATPPSAGTSCSAVGEDCEYGSSWWLWCNLVVQCTADAGWQPVSEHIGGGCAEPDAGDAGGTCPSTWAEATTMDAGSAMCPAVNCNYPEGSCACILGCGCAGQRQEMDLHGAWFCTPTPPGCPSPRPDLGTACTNAGPGCTYGRTCGCGIGVSCVDGVWQGELTTCCP